MTCAKAMFTDFVSASPEQTVADALNLLEQHGVRAMPILDAEGTLVGEFHFRVLLAHLLPITGEIDLMGMGTASGGLLDHNLKLSSLIGGRSEMKCADRFKALMPIPLQEVMDPNFVLTHPETPLLECIRLLVKHRGLLGVVEKGEKKLIGMVTVQSIVRVLERTAAES
jgi:CBS domain-containing protein